MAARTAVNPPATEVAPVTLVVGEEEFLVDRAVRDLIAAAHGPARWSIEPAAAGTMEHRAGYGRLSGTSCRLDLHPFKVKVKINIPNEWWCPHSEPAPADRGGTRPSYSG